MEISAIRKRDSGKPIRKNDLLKCESTMDSTGYTTSNNYLIPKELPLIINCPLLD